MLDQFSRNCHRNTPRAFAADHHALRIAQQMIASGADLLLPAVHHRAFAYLPFEHDETLASQHESLRLFKQLKAEPGGASYYSLRRSGTPESSNVSDAFRIAMRCSGVQSTDEERAFLKRTRLVVLGVTAT